MPQSFFYYKFQKVFDDCRNILATKWHNFIAPILPELHLILIEFCNHFKNFWNLSYLITYYIMLSHPKYLLRSPFSPFRFTLAPPFHAWVIGLFQLVLQNWNKLSTNIRLFRSISIFKKPYLFSIAFPSHKKVCNLNFLYTVYIFFSFYAPCVCIVIMGTIALGDFLTPKNTV